MSTMQKFILLVLTFGLCSVANAASHEVIICNTCESAASYANTARSQGFGNVVVINLDTHQQKHTE